jgi:hypothetical protein
MTSDLATSRRAAVDAFLEHNRQKHALANTRPRLVFGLDATASREPTWAMARELQSEMFQEAAKIGLNVQLVFYRASECQASRWVDDAAQLSELMLHVRCQAGYTQIGKILSHTRRENSRHKVDALVLVADSVEEKDTDLFALARELGCPAFLFQENDRAAVAKVFCEIARVTGGAHCHFAPGAAQELAELLRAVAAYATGGRQALLANKTAAAAKLLLQLPSR